MNYYHVDVFSSEILAGNALTVIIYKDDMNTQYMQSIAKEFKQFETIFIRQIEEKRFSARIFTVDEELDFAGHPILGAMAVIHEKLYSEERSITAVFELNNKAILTESTKMEDYLQVAMNQGIPEFFGAVEDERVNVFLHALNLTTENLYPKLPMEVVSTGLPYLIIPLVSGLEQAKIIVKDFEEQLSRIHAKFVYVFDVAMMEGRTWDNSGATEDVATGSAAGPTVAYLSKWNICKMTDTIIINQGSFVGRPSKIKVYADHSSREIHVAGDVRIIANGTLFL